MLPAIVDFSANQKFNIEPRFKVITAKNLPKHYPHYLHSATTLSIMTLSVMTFSITAFSMTINKSRHST